MRIREDKFAAPEEVVGGAPAVPPTPTAPVAPKAAAEEVPPEIEGLTPVQVLEKAKAENARIVAELTGTFTQTGGTNTVGSDLNLANQSGSAGTYRLSGGALNVTGNITSGSGTSKLMIDGGSLTVGGGSINVKAFDAGYVDGT
ncbi:MAG: hypothetical protein K1000chlam2_01174, partial [Chlamydiae bacterium]|nr:hypothetical protein [Chlamydiota bacterium]